MRCASSLGLLAAAHVFVAACKTPDSGGADAKKPVAHAGASAASERVQLAGTYRGILDDGQGTEIGFEYLRFAADGTVTTLSTSAAMEPWTGDAQMPLRRGTYKASGNIVTFTVSGGGRTVEYAGTIRGNDLLLKWRVEKEGRGGSAFFSFVPSPANAASPPTGSPASKPSLASPPDGALKPPGTTWFCTRAKSEKGMSNCQRALKACQGFRKDMQTKLPKETFTECAEQPKAHCHSVTSKSEQRAIAFCYQRVEDCEASGNQVRQNENPAEYEVSECVAW
jgi:hypothetical protein